MIRKILAAGVVLTLLAPSARAQFGAIPKAEELVHVHAAPVRVAPGASAEVVVSLAVLKSWHVNANPANESSIPTVVQLAGAPGLTIGAPKYPAPHIVKLPIDDQPLKVYDGTVELRVPISAAAGAAGAHALKGTLKFQACNDQICLPPASVAFDASVQIGAAGAVPPSAAPPPSGAAPETASAAAPADTAAPAAPAPSAGFATGPPPSGTRAIAPSPLAGVLDRGGWAAFLTLFLIGLALNLTPCVYPMLSVTVSIFGARRAAPTAQVVGSALLYVLGMATMYSVLGVTAAFTGGLFGGWLANPWVSVGIGVLLIALSLSMFGLYELNAPSTVLSRLGGTGATSAIGIFLSGLVVGVFAAPCVGPPVVALLAVVSQKGDPLFGFTSFFTLAMGLGAPYLVLGTFSGLLQKLPRSGDWMVWVERVFGVILFGVGLNYALIALAPKLAAWVLPAALILAGLWLGFLEKSGSPKRGFRAFKKLAGGLAIAAGVWLVLIAQRKALAFEPLASADIPARAAHQAYVIDFSADWCQPCHELERLTFTDPRVMSAMREFKLYKVDLTRYDSPESDRWRREFGIHGVPTLVFVRSDGAEVSEARVEGFLPAKAFLERVARASASAPR